MIVEIYRDLEIELFDVQKSVDPGWYTIIRHGYPVVSHVNENGTIDGGFLVGRKMQELEGQEGVHIEPYKNGVDSSMDHIVQTARLDPNADEEMTKYPEKYRDHTALTDLNQLAMKRHKATIVGSRDQEDQDEMEELIEDHLKKIPTRVIQRIDEYADEHPDLTPRKLKEILQHEEDKLRYVPGARDMISTLTNGHDAFRVQSRPDANGEYAIYHGPPELHGVKLGHIPQEMIADHRPWDAKLSDRWERQEPPAIFHHVNGRSYYDERLYKLRDPLGYRRDILADRLPEVEQDEVPNRVQSAFTNNVNRRITPERLQAARERLDATPMLGFRRHDIENIYRKFGDEDKLARDAAAEERLHDEGDTHSDFADYYNSRLAHGVQYHTDEHWAEDGDPEKRRMFTGEFNSFNSNVPKVETRGTTLHPRVVAESFGAPHGSDVSLDRRNDDRYHIKFSHPQHGSFHFSIGDVGTNGHRLRIHDAQPGPGRAGERASAQILHQAFTSPLLGYFTSDHQTSISASAAVHPKVGRILTDMGFDEHPETGDYNTTFGNSRPGAPNIYNYAEKNHIGMRTRMRP